MKGFFVSSAVAAALLLQSVQVAQAEQVQVRMFTSLGTVELALDGDKAPVSVANFVRYAKAGKYNGTIFHRVIPNFMIQGGGFDQQMHKRDTYDPIINEADNGLPNSVGSIAMARTSDPNSASNQFFINTKDNPFLNHSSKTARGWGYAVFGRVTKGMSVVRRIEAVETTSMRGMQNVPKQPVVIERVEVVEWRDGPVAR